MKLPAIERYLYLQRATNAKIEMAIKYKDHDECDRLFKRYNAIHSLYPKVRKATNQAFVFKTIPTAILIIWLLGKLLGGQS